MHVQQQNQALALDGIDAETAGAGQTVGGMTGENGLGELHNTVDELAGQTAHILHLLLQMLTLQAGSFAQAHDAGDVLGAAAATLFLTAAGDDGSQHHTLADVDGAHALGGVDLVAGQAQQVDVHGLDIHGHVTKGLYRVGVEQHALAAAQRADVGDVVDGTNLVVGKHNAHQGGIFGDGGLQIAEAYLTGAVDGQVGDLEALFLQCLCGAQDGRMLDGRGDHVLFALGLGGLQGAAQGHIVAFAAAAGEEYLTGVAVQRQGDFLAGVFQRHVAALAQLVQRTCVAVLGGQEGQHFIQNAAVNGGGCRIVRINKTMFHIRLLLFPPKFHPIQRSISSIL